MVQGRGPKFIKAPKQFTATVNSVKNVGISLRDQSDIKNGVNRNEVGSDEEDQMDNRYLDHEVAQTGRNKYGG